jgi:hypothetical protein
MIRIEIIANRSVEENILEALKDEGVGKYYTKYPAVFGVGTSGPRMGDAIWPEENFALVFWCDHEEALGIESAIAYVKERFPDEGIKIFGLPEHESALRAVPVQAGANFETTAKSPESPENRYNPFQAETRPAYTATDRFAGPAAERTESRDSFTEKTAKQDRFEKQATGSGQSRHPGKTAAEYGRSTAIPADTDDWLGPPSFMQETPPAPVPGPEVSEQEPAPVPASGTDASEQEPVPVREVPPQTGYDEWYRPQPEERARTPPSPEPERTSELPYTGSSGMEDENF